MPIFFNSNFNRIQQMARFGRYEFNRGDIIRGETQQTFIVDRNNVRSTPP